MASAHHLLPDQPLQDRSLQAETTQTFHVSKTDTLKSITMPSADRRPCQAWWELPGILYTKMTTTYYIAT